MEQHLKKALDNITRYGDTDVFPFPLENTFFFDRPAEALKILVAVHKDFAKTLEQDPPVNESILTAVGYAGFRWATQIDPLWNAYFLGLLIALGDDIEAARVPKEKDVVFSYRFEWDKDEKTLFDKNYGWVSFQKKSIELARQYKHVLVCDISDFYHRIYHHRLENALRKATKNIEAANRIMELLKNISKGVSYGLPVGGPAARLLSELLLNRLDRLLLTNKVVFCRFADDYHIFADTTEEAYNKLVFLSEKLLENEGMLLQKAKTRVMTSEEFLAASEYSDNHDDESLNERNTRNFLSLRLHFDPYSGTAVEEYDQLIESLSQFDVVGMLAKELRKSRVHQTLTKKLVNSLKHLDAAVVDSTIASLTENLAILYPVFPNVMLLIKAVIGNLSVPTRNLVFSTIRHLIDAKSYIVMVPVHLAYAVRLLSYDQSEETDEVLSRVYRESNSILIRRDIILSMAKRGADYWISDIRKNYSTLSSWEKVALLVASYILDDEGSHWRKSLGGQLTPLQSLASAWAAAKKNSTGISEIPL